MINLFFFNNFYPVIPINSKGKRRIIVYGLVTRYGPQSVVSATDWELRLTNFEIQSSLKRGISCIVDESYR